MATPDPPPAYLASPRATMSTFLNAINEAAASSDRDLLRRAAECLDLSGLSPLLRDQDGPRLAVKLKAVLDRLEFIDLDQLPADPAAESPWTFQPEPAIRITRQDSGAWRFAQSTVEALDDLYPLYESRPIVQGVTSSGESLLPELWLRSRIPSSLRLRWFLLDNWQWLALLLLTLLGVVADRGFTAFARYFLRSRFQRWLAHVDTALLAASLRPYGLVVMAGVWRVAIPLLDLPPPVLAALVVAIRFVGVSGFVWGSYRMVDVATAALEHRARQTRTRFDDLLVPLVHRSLKIFIAVFGVVFIADTMDVPIASLLAGLGLGGLAFAFAAQDLVANLFGSLTIILDRPFEVGDWVVIGDIEGTVEQVGFRSSRIRTFYDSQITLPNSRINTAAVDNLGRRRFRRWNTRLALTYDTPPEKIEAFTEGVRELVRLHPHTRKDLGHVYLNEFGPASLEVLLYVFFAAPDWAGELQARHNLALDILRLAQRLGVEFAFPTQTLYLRRGASPEPGSPGAPADDRVAAALNSGREAAAAITARSSPTPPPPSSP